MRKMLLALAGAALLAAVMAAPSLSAAAKSVEVGDNYFVRDAGHATLSIKKGQALAWHWTGKHMHNVTVKSGPQKFHSATLGHGGSYTHAFTKAGTYTIYCTIHGLAAMSMKVVVK